LTNGQNQIYIRKIFVSRFFCNQLYVFLPLIEILTKIINHTNKETVYNLLTGKKPVIFARWVSLNIWLRLFNITPLITGWGALRSVSLLVWFMILVNISIRGKNIIHQIIVEVTFISLTVHFFREFIFTTNLMRNQEKSFSNSLVRAQAQLH
jgi:hypothetical protein